MLVLLFTNWLKREWGHHIRIVIGSFLASNHLKKVVEPPEPYSRTSMSGFRIEHINSTPPLSNITVLKANKSKACFKSFLDSFWTCLRSYLFSSFFDKALQLFIVLSDYVWIIVKTDLPFVWNKLKFNWLNYIPEKHQTLNLWRSHYRPGQLY